MRYSHRLRRVFYQSPGSSMMRAVPNRAFYLKKRGRGLGHVQAFIALARHRFERPVGPTHGADEIEDLDGLFDLHLAHRAS